MFGFSDSLKFKLQIFKFFDLNHTTMYNNVMYTVEVRAYSLAEFKKQFKKYVESRLKIDAYLFVLSMIDADLYEKPTAFTYYCIKYMAK